MKSEKLMDAITNLDEDLLEEARKEPSEGEKKAIQRGGQILSPSFLRAACAVLVVGILAGAVLLFTRPGRQDPGPEPYAAGRTESVHTGTEESQPSVITGGVTPLPSETGKETEIQPSETAEAGTAEVPETTADIPDDERRAAALALPEYPEKAFSAAYTVGREIVDLYRSFFADMMLLLLSEEDRENAVMSPVNIFMTAAMLAEVTGGETRQEILNAMGVGSISELREQAAGLETVCYKNIEGGRLLLGNSIWLSDETDYQESTVRRLADKYYASSFRGEPGSEEYDTLFREWLNTMTGGILEEQVAGEALDPASLLTLASTVYLKTAWEKGSQFDPALTEDAVFHGAKGDRTVPFMYREKAARTYYRGENYSLVPLVTGLGSVYFFLPDEGVSVGEMMTAQSFRNCLSYKDWENIGGLTRVRASVNLTVPRLDLDAVQDLGSSLQKLGIRRCFDPEKADFSPLLSASVSVSSVKQSSRLIMNEEGITAAAAVITVFAGSAPEEIDIVIDRPFFLLVTGDHNVPLFAAVVNEP